MGALGTSSSPRSAFAQDTPPDITQLSPEQQAELGSLLNKAQVLFEEGDFAESIAVLNRAYAIFPHPRILYKLGEAHERLGNAAEALRFYNDYLASGDGAEDKSRVKGLVANLERKLASPGTVIITAEPADAMILIEAPSFKPAPSPLDRTIKPGRYSVQISKDGYKTITTTIEVEANSTTRASYVLEAIEQTEPPSDANMLPSNIAFGTGAVALLTGATFLGLGRADDAYLDAAESQRQTQRRPDDYDLRVSRYNRRMILGAGLASVGAIGVGLGLVLRRSAKQPAGTAHIAPTVSSDGAGVTFEWRY